MNNTNFGKFGPLIGVVYVGNTHCKFLVYSTKNAEVLTYHELKLKQIIHNSGWLEYDPNEIWKHTQECITTAHRNLVILEINTQDIIAVAICTQRGTTVMWDKETGIPLCNAIGWSDCRSASALKTILKNVNGNLYHLKHMSGLPLSTCFSALKIKWLMENVTAVTDAMKGNTCLFGTLDSWLLWNLTGGFENGVHTTDVTNAGYTLLMNVSSLKWDKKLCDFFKIPQSILPRIRTNSEIYGYVTDGPLKGVPIASCIGDQPASLLGQHCTKVGSVTCSIDDSGFVLLNTGSEIIESENGLLTSIAYKLGEKGLPCYCLEGAISNAGSTVTWLQERMCINTEISQHGNVAEALTSFLGESSMTSSACSSTLLNADCGLASKRSEITFVPAFHGLYSPYWRYDARGILLGLTSQTTSENVTQAAFEATGFQILEILEAFKKDAPSKKNPSAKERLIVGGDFAENNSFLQYITDIIGCLVERPQTTSAPCLGAMIAAGICMNVITLQNAEKMYLPPADAFMPTTTPNRRELLYRRWDYAVKKCLNWNNFETFENDIELFSQREKDPNLQIRRSIPGSFFLTSSFVLLLVAKFLQEQKITSL